MIFYSIRAVLRLYKAVCMFTKQIFIKGPWNRDRGRDGRDGRGGGCPVSATAILQFTF